MWPPWSSFRALAAWVLGTVVVLGLGGLLFAWSGLYSVAASRGHLAIVSAMLEFAMRSSVRTHSLLVTPPPLDDPDLVKLGGGHFAGGCAPCHGAPGQPRNPITRHMLPEPPQLSTAVSTWNDRELFWIVKHGLKYTGMPAWVAHGRDDEVWAVVAFLRKLPGMTPENYRALSLGNIREADLSADEILRAGTVASALAACARCHGDAGSHPTSRLVPKLAGQSQAYLERALREYAAATRPSGIMQPVAAELEEDQIALLAAYYAGLPARAAQQLDATDRALIDAGRRIATEGLPRADIPPCLACHAEGSPAMFPRLAGQHVAYTVGQLRLWKNGLRGDTVAGNIMASIAPRLSEEHMLAVAAYFASLTAAATPAASSAAEGSRPQ